MKSQQLFSVWEGVYESFSHAGGDIDAFESQSWIQKQQIEVNKALESLKVGGHASQDYPLSLVVAMALATHDKLTILDFGGGMGIQYIELLAKVPDARTKVRYHIVEGQSLNKNLPPDLKHFPNLSFHTSLEDIQENVDIIHTGSSIQYIEDWKNLLTRLTQQFKAKYLIFSDLLAGNVPTFVSHQLYYDKKIPHVILNWDEFEKFVTKDIGYILRYKSKFIRKILDQEEVYPNFGLPETHRIERGLNVIFVRE